MIQNKRLRGDKMLDKTQLKRLKDMIEWLRGSRNGIIDVQLDRDNVNSEGNRTVKFKAMIDIIDIIDDETMYCYCGYGNTCEGSMSLAFLRMFTDKEEEASYFCEWLITNKENKNEN